MSSVYVCDDCELCLNLHYFRFNISNLLFCSLANAKITECVAVLK